VLVVVAARANEAASVADLLYKWDAAKVTFRAVGRARTLVYGGPFDDRGALQAASHLRLLGWSADVRPEGGGHLAAWRNHTRPTVIEGRIWVCFPWSEFDRDQAHILTEIDPGRAFGTGAHPTTKLLLRELATRLQGNERVLDVGTGSGVLAIAAAQLGASDVTAIDISPTAVAATKTNARRNQVEVRAMDTPVAELTETYDVIVANLDASTLTQLAPAVQRCLAPRGWVALSGISPAQVSKVAATYKGVCVIGTPSEEDWSALVMGTA
jgi:ribosomal protein L11 methyltransferase